MPANEVINDADVVLLFLCCPLPSYCRVTIHPVFTPNEHLWKSDKSGKQKWEILANAVRQVMLRESGLEPNEGHWKEHIHYYKYLDGQVDNYLLPETKAE